MLHATLPKAVFRPSQYLTLFVVFTVSNLIACGRETGGGFSLPDDVQSVQSALTYRPPDAYGGAFFSATGVECYQKSGDYVCAVDLRRAHFRTVHGDIFPGTESFALKTVRSYWDGSPSTDLGRKKVIAVNTSFFQYVVGSTSPREISFPYKQYGNPLPLTLGKDCVPANPTYRRKLLHFWIDRQYADIGDYVCTSMTDQAAISSFGSAPDIIGGLETTVPKGMEKTQRTFFGVRNDERDVGGSYETLFIYASSSSVTQSYAEQQLKDFGADKVMMFDGGGSSQLIINGSTKVSNSRLLPNALIVYAP